MVHDQQAAMLSAIAVTRDHEGFTKAMEVCGETQGSLPLKYNL
jgi:hypothetical protein